MLPDFKLYYKAIIIKTVWYWHKNRQTDRWNRIESPEINPHTYQQLIYNKGAKNIQQRKDSLFNKLGKLDSHMQKNETRPLSYTILKINSKWIKDLNVRHETVKFPEENIGGNITDISLSNVFVDLTPGARKTKVKMKNWEYIRLKTSS